jgi:uncharacterized membrane protein
MRFKTIGLAVAACVALAACGTNTTDRTVSGAGLGAATGAVVGAVVGGPILGAALIGGAAGAVAGAVTDPNKVNFGPPLWDR